MDLDSGELYGLGLEEGLSTASVHAKHRGRCKGAPPTLGRIEGAAQAIRTGEGNAEKALVEVEKERALLEERLKHEVERREMEKLWEE